MIYQSIIDATGNTPIVQLQHVYEGLGSMVAKVEYMNPGHSVKDRIAIKMIEDAEQKGLWKPEEPSLKAHPAILGWVLRWWL